MEYPIEAGPLLQQVSNHKIPNVYIIYIFIATGGAMDTTSKNRTISTAGI